MSVRATAVLTLLLMYGATAVANAADVYRTEDSHLAIGGQLHVQGSFQYLEDPFRDDVRPYLFLNLARFYLDGSKDGWRYRMSLAFGGEAEVKAPSPGIALNLLDLYADAPLGKHFYLRFGQFKVPYGRERLTAPNELLFADRSIHNLGSRVGRDVGGALAANFGPVMAAAGVFTGGGTNIPVRDIPLELGTPMIVARAGVQHGLDEDIFATREEAHAVADKLMGGVFVNGLYVKDSKVGHSSVLRTKASEKSLVLNGNWNPLLGRAPFEPGEMWQAGVDAVVRAPAGPGAVAAELEGNVASFSNAYGSLEVWGGRAQVSYALRDLPLEIALRYAVLFPGSELKIGDKAPIHQVTPALVYRVGELLRVVADVPMQFNAPTVVENGIGKYVLTTQPDQIAYAESGGILARENVYGARLMLQSQF